MTSKDADYIADLIERADLITLLIKGEKAALGKDIQASIVTALRVLAIDTRKLEEQDELVKSLGKAS